MRAQPLKRIDYRITHITIKRNVSRWRRLRAWLESIGLVLVVGVIGGWIGL